MPLWRQVSRLLKLKLAAINVIKRRNRQQELECRIEPARPVPYSLSGEIVETSRLVILIRTSANKRRHHTHANAGRRHARLQPAQTQPRELNGCARTGCGSQNAYGQ